MCMNHCICNRPHSTPWYWLFFLLCVTSLVLRSCFLGIVISNKLNLIHPLSQALPSKEPELKLLWKKETKNKGPERICEASRCCRSERVGMGADKRPDWIERPIQNEVSCAWHWRPEEGDSLAQYFGSILPRSYLQSPIHNSKKHN